MIYLIRNKPIDEDTSFAMFDSGHGAALFMWGKAADEWSFALAGQSYRPVIEICSDSSITTFEIGLIKLIDKRNKDFAAPTCHDRDNALNALMRKRACGDMPGYFVMVMNKCLKTKTDIDNFIELCDRKDTKIGMGAYPSGNSNTYDITIHNGMQTLAEWRHHDSAT